MTDDLSTDAPTQLRIMGVSVAMPLAWEVSARLRDEANFDTAEVIETALTHGIPSVRLTLDDCEAILSVLKDPSPAFIPLRDAVLEAHAKRMRDVGGPYRDYPADDPDPLEDA